MKIKPSHAILLITLSILIPSLAYGQKTSKKRRHIAPKMIQDEFVKESKAYQRKIVRVNDKLFELKAKKRDLKKDIILQGKFEAVGVTYFHRYVKLLQTRYIDKDGDFDGSLRLGKKDRSNINQLFKTYLRKVAILSDISSKKAVTLLENGAEELEELSIKHSDPSDEEIPGLQIASHKIEAAERERKVLLHLVDKLGLRGINGKMRSIIKTSGKRVKKSQKSS